MSIHSSVRISRLRSKCDTVWELKFKRVVFFEIDRDRIVCVGFLSFFLTNTCSLRKYLFTPSLLPKAGFPSDGVFLLLRLTESK